MIIASPLYAFLKQYRIARLRKSGVKIGKNVFISNTIFDSVFPHLITISDECTLTSGTVILTHDASTSRYLKCTKVGKVFIGKKTFVGANSVILPNVNIGSNVIIGAGSVVSTDLPDGVVAVGCPAKIIDTTENYLNKHAARLEKRKVNRHNRRELLAALDTYGLVYA